MSHEQRQEGRSQPRRTPRRRRSRFVTLASWPLLFVLWVWALAWIPSGSLWTADLLANLAAQGLILTVASAVIWLVARRRVLFSLALLACCVHFWIIGTGRAALTPRSFDPATRLPGAVRLLHYNASHKRPPAEVYAMIEEAMPDVASIAEPNVPLQYEVLYGEAMTETHPYRLKRHFRQRGPDDRVGAGIVLSRWPLEEYPIGEVVSGEVAEDFIAGVLTIPAGAGGAATPARMGLIAIHPRSPRSASRWAHGNEVVKACAALSRKMQQDGLPVIVLADLNSTASGWRSRELFFEGGLRRAKPLLSAGGTYPARFEFGQHGPFRMYWPATIAIDDAFVSPGFHIRGWTRLDPAGSDHWPILVEVVLPAP